MSSTVEISEDRKASVLRKAIVPEEPRRHPLVSIVIKTRIGIVILAAIGAWWLVVEWLDLPHYLLPSPDSVVDKFLSTPSLYLDAFLVTALESIGGFSVAALGALTLSILMARSRLLEDIIFPYLAIIRVMPIVAIAPLLIIWFGHGMTPMIIVSALIAFFPIVVNTLLGLRSADPDLIDLMRSLNASEGQILRKIRLPNALPYVLSSFRIAAPGAVIGALVGEFVGGVRGLGFILVTAHGRLDTAAVFLMVALSVLLGLVFFVLVIAVERRVLRWHPSSLDELS